jgi:hypothetical protein
MGFEISENTFEFSSTTSNDKNKSKKRERKNFLAVIGRSRSSRRRIVAVLILLASTQKTSVASKISLQVNSFQKSQWHWLVWKGISTKFFKGRI